WLTTAPKMVQKIAEYPPPLMVPMTIPERLKEYQALQAKVNEVENDYLPKYGTDAFPKFKTAKGNLNKWRAELKPASDKQHLDFQRALRDRVLVDIAKNALPPEYKVNAADPLTSLQTIHYQLLLKKASGEDIRLSPQADKVFEYAIDKKKDKQDPNEP